MKSTTKQSFARLVSGLAVATLLAGTGDAVAQQGEHPPKTDARARVVPHDTAAFGADPDYGQPKYDFQAQLDIYGAKYLNKTQRPLLELGRDLYQNGPFRKASNVTGKHNILTPQLLVYGDLRAAGGYNTAGVNTGTAAARLNLSVDLKLTASERVHALFRPFEKDGNFARYDFAGDSTGFQSNFDGTPAALFFEGDVGAILGGLSGRDAPFDMPIAAGLMPLLFHNGVWLEDAFTGVAITIPARNSAALDWSNFDISLFAGFDGISNGGVGTGQDGNSIFGMNTFIEAYHGYIEAGYGFVMGVPDSGQDFHSVGLSFTRRYGGRISNSMRYIGSIAQRTPTTQTAANGHLFLLENSLISSRPSTVVPYFNLFAGIGNPVSAARDPGAGGILKNTGLNFETDALTAFPALNATAQDAVGGAIGINLLGSSLDRQLVLEVAGSYPHKKSAAMPGEQFAFGMRAQKNLTNAMLVRIDGMVGRRKDLSNISGVRLELRHKF